LYRRIIERLWSLAEKEGIDLRRSYRDPVGNPRLAREGISVITPADLKRATKGTPAWRRLRRLIRLRPRVEAVIGHLKSGFRLCRNYLHVWEGDELNILLAAAGWNLRKLMRFPWLAKHAAVLLVIAVSYSAGWDGSQGRLAPG
jgi:hypothetical protein